ncbi:MAG: hypothetical protein IT379_32655 [Deltaproteobacteria bacterium]|nr:hypothetical protein [Deltaproteobacteria bacterium]
MATSAKSTKKPAKAAVASKKPKVKMAVRASVKAGVISRPGQGIVKGG